MDLAEVLKNYRSRYDSAVKKRPQDYPEDLRGKSLSLSPEDLASMLDPRRYPWGWNRLMPPAETEFKGPAYKGRIGVIGGGVRQDDVGL